MNYICPNCNKVVDVQGAGSFTCPHCQKIFSVESITAEEIQIATEKLYELSCPKCHSTKILMQNETQINVSNRGCLGWLLWIVLACCTLGLILIIPAMTNTKVKSKNNTIAICKNCGHHWKI